MALVGLDFPTDIRWQRVCHSEDMTDTNPCDEVAPPKWQSSIAVYRYVPEDEYQSYEGRRLIYYKVTCTISSYQPRADEVEGAIAKAGTLTTGEAQELDRKLKSYAPCNGAILQVTVAPQEDGVRRRDYPYISQVQPNQRALYEQVTDTNEVASRSLEELSVTKGAGTTKSQEVLDIDKGKSVSGQVQVSGQYAGVGGGVGVGGSYTHNIEQGTKALGQQGRSRTETTDSLREAREATSHTTQLTQMYNLLQAYHVGTNRVMFYVTPRPHSLEEPSGFIRGPREIDGVQDFFLIVNQDEDQKLPCLSVRLDTGHLSKTDEMVYDESEPPTELSVSAYANPPGELDPNKTAAPEGGDPGFSLHYDCFESPEDVDPASITAKPGYVVKEVTDIGAIEVNRGSTELVIDPPPPEDGRSVTLTAKAKGHACYRNSQGDRANDLALIGAGSGIAGFLGTIGGGIAAATGADAPGLEEVKNVEIGYARRRVRVHWRSAAKTKKVGERLVLLITTRVLCCCDEPSTPPKIVEIIPLELPEPEFRAADPRPFEREQVIELPDEDGSPITTPSAGITTPSEGTTTAPSVPPSGMAPSVTPAVSPSGLMTAREANDLAANVVTETARVASSIDNPAKAPARDTELALARVAELALDIPRLRRRLIHPAETIEGLGDAAEKRLTKVPLPDSPAGTAPSRLSVAAAPTSALADSLHVDESDAVQLRLAAMGFGKAPRGAGRARRRRT
jgi:hypothetical protein